MEKILKIGMLELGISEYSGKRHNERIIRYAKEIGIHWINDDETPWCSIFMNWVAMQAGYEFTNKANARSWLTIGTEIATPEPGDIVVYWRKSKSSRFGHVGIFLGYSEDKSRIYTLGGNQGNAVSVSGYSESRLISFRRLSKKRVSLTNGVLGVGSKGLEVSQLQDALKIAGFSSGTSDGNYGPITEKAIKNLQKKAGGKLTVTGIYDYETKLFLKVLIGTIKIKES